MQDGKFIAVVQFIDRSKAHLMTSSQTHRSRLLGHLAHLTLCALAAIPGAVSGQEPAGDRRVIAAPREDLIEFEGVVDPLALPREERLARHFNVLAFGQGDTEQARRRLESRLKSRIEQIDRVCKLTPEQRSKLSVAGRGDIKRAFARIDELKEKLSGPIPEVDRRGQLLLEVAQHRQVVTETDCFGDGSLFTKVLKNTLTPEQFAARQKAAKDASIAQHQGTIRWVVGSMNTWLQLSPAQHEKLESLLFSRTRAPRKFGEYDYYGLMFQASRLSEKELKPIFNGDQWQRLERQFAEARRLETILRGGGFLPDEDVADAGSARGNEPISEPVQPRC